MLRKSPWCVLHCLYTPVTLTLCCELSDFRLGVETFAYYQSSVTQFRRYPAGVSSDLLHAAYLLSGHTMSSEVDAIYSHVSGMQVSTLDDTVKSFGTDANRWGEINETPSAYSATHSRSRWHGGNIPLALLNLWGRTLNVERAARGL